MTILLFFHSLFRWLVVLSLFASIVVAWRGYIGTLVFDKKSNLLRHWTATIAHVQLVLGMLIAFQSPYFKFFWQNMDNAWSNIESVFYGLIHPSLMFVAIIILTIASAKAKRKATDREKFKTILIWYTIVFVIIFVAIPWPFYPLSNRSLIPNF